MEKSPSNPFDDVGQETYQGPSAHIAALGTGVVKHLKWAGLGILGGGLFALAFPKPAKIFVEEARELGRKWKYHVPKGDGFFDRAYNEIKYSGGRILHFLFGDEDMAHVLEKAANEQKELGAARKQAALENSAMAKRHGFGHAFISHVPGSIPGLGKWIKDGLKTFTADEYRANALTFGGLFGAGGYVSGWLVALFTGAQHGNKGRHQFERAKDQIQSLQEDNGDLTRINEELRKKYITAATRLDTIAASQADAAARSEAPVAPDTAALKESAALTQLSDTQHHGKLAQPELAVA